MLKSKISTLHNVYTCKLHTRNADLALHCIILHRNCMKICQNGCPNKRPMGLNSANLRNETISKTTLRFFICRSTVTKVKVICSKILVSTKWPCQKEQVWKIWQHHLKKHLPPPAPKKKSLWPPFSRQWCPCLSLNLQPSEHGCGHALGL